MKKDPPTSSLELRDVMRHCIWSELYTDTLEPGYRCTHNWKHKRKWCLLYTGQCRKHEQFPEKYGT